MTYSVRVQFRDNDLCLHLSNAFIGVFFCKRLCCWNVSLSLTRHTTVDINYKQFWTPQTSRNIHFYLLGSRIKYPYYKPLIYEFQKFFIFLFFSLLNSKTKVLGLNNYLNVSIFNDIFMPQPMLKNTEHLRS